MQSLKQYLNEAMGLQVTGLPAGQLRALPHFLSQLYEPCPMMVGGHRWLGVFLREGEDLKPATFEKHVTQLPWEGAEGYFLIAKSLPGYVRKRLIERRIPFVIPGSQVYLPQLGMELRPRQSDAGPVQLEKMSPATQFVVILALNKHLNAVVSPLMVAQQTGYTAMTMTRAWNELEALGIGSQVRQGKQRLLSFPNDLKGLWQRARALMRDPVQEQIRVSEEWISLDMRCLAGESALAEQSMLAAPKVPVYALSRDDWKKLEGAGAKHIPLEEPGTCLVQVWRYPPRLDGERTRVDPFSLSLSLQGIPDERVQSALEEMMEQYPW